MKKLFALLSSLFAVIFLAACGDTVENTTVNQMGMEVVASEDDLPECTNENEGEQAFVKDEDATRICVDGKWKKSENGSDSGDFSCTTKELKDKSGLKIICNGDSIGVILNGKDGKEGKKGENGKNGEEGSGCSFTQNDTAVTVICGDDTTVIELGARETSASDSDEVSLDSLAGHSQKGPFLKGSTVYLYELDNGKTLKQTNGNFTSYITRDDGYYKFTARNLVSPYALVIVDGNYRNEVTGDVSAQPIRLKALSDVRKHHKGANVNILTHLEYEYVYNLVTKQGMNFAAAKKKAQEDIFKAFHISLKSTEDAETLDIFGSTDADAALLALSVLLQGDRSEADMMVLLTEISNAIAETGEWNDSATKVLFADWALQADSDRRLDQIRSHIKNWHISSDTTVPDFEKFVRNFINVESLLGECDEQNEGAFAHVPNPKSAYFAEAYDSINVTKNSLARFVCDVKDGFHWRMATDLERDTKGWKAGKDGDLQMGQIDTGLVYVYDGAWRHGTELDRRLDSACTSKRLNSMDSIVQGKDTVWYKCMDGVEKTSDGSTWTAEWMSISELESDSVFWATHKDSVGTLLKGRGSGKIVVWDDGAFREPSDKEVALGRGCVSYMQGKKFTLSNSLLYECDGSAWSKKGKFTDGRDFQVYEAALIGTQTWMSENLRYDYRYSYSKNFKCVDNFGSSSLTRCFYSWAAAMDTSAYFSEDAERCGNHRTCTRKADIVHGVCPEGWHLPSREEWNTLIDYVGGLSVAGANLKAETGWSNGNGTDTHGFSALPYGYRFDSMSSGSTSGAYFWTSTERSSNTADNIQILGDASEVILDTFTKTHFVPVRCVKD